MKNGQEAGSVLYSKSAKAWASLLSYENVVLVTAERSETKKKETAPHFSIMTARDAPANDECRILRPVPVSVVPFLQASWIEKINKKYGSDKNKLQKVLSHYKKVLEWHPSSMSASRMNPMEYVNGTLGFMRSNVSMLSIVQKPPVESRKTGDAEERAAKKARPGSSADADSVTTESTPFDQVEGGRVWRLGESGKVHTYDGCVRDRLPAPAVPCALHNRGPPARRNGFTYAVIMP